MSGVHRAARKFQHRQDPKGLRVNSGDQESADNVKPCLPLALAKPLGSYAIPS